MADLTVVLVSYNTKDLLQACLESLLREKGTLDLQILVVDNGSKDGSPDMIRTFAPAVTLLDMGRNTWFTGGNNLGAEKATGDYVFILNCDTVILPSTLQTMLNYLKAHPHVGALSCRMEYPDGGVQYTCSRVPKYMDLLYGYTFLGVLLAPLRNRRRRAMWYDGWHRDGNRGVEVIPGSNIMMTRQLWQEMGGFDDTMRLYFAEDDLCQRILNKGLEIHFTAETYFLHYEHASVAKVQRLASQVYFDDLLVFSNKWYGKGRTTFLHALIVPTRWAMELAQRLRGERHAL